mmetsp:Transcript_10713/g.17738  ORF Transcript_10713/g.17738 Transcript_10713/m.17738 type:complete len:230 (+) Transcript_10713:451-1140(+)
MRNGHIIQHDLESTRPHLEFRRNIRRYLVTLGEKFIGIVTSDDSLGTFVHNAGQDAFIVIFSEVTINPNEFIWIGLVQDTNRNRDHLQILTTGQCLQIDRTRANIVNDGTFEPRNVEIQSFAVDCFLHTGQTIKDNGAMTSFHIVEGIVSTVSQTNGNESGSCSAACSVSDATAATTTRRHVGHVFRHALKGVSELFRHDCCIRYMYIVGSSSVYEVVLLCCCSNSMQL